jgi:DNA-binding MarR family transcriptional regulator
MTADRRGASNADLRDYGVAPRSRRAPLERIARALVAQTKARARFVPAASNDDPQWLMLLELYIAARSDRQVSVSSLCVAAGVPSTTALRHMRSLERNGLVVRTAVPSDRRIALLQLTARARNQIEAYLASIAPNWRGLDEEPTA